MHAEDLCRHQYFILDYAKHRTHRVDIDGRRVWIETTNGTLLSVPLGAYVEPATASTKVVREGF